MTKTDPNSESRPPVPEPSWPLPPKSGTNPVLKEEKEIAKDFLLAEHNVIKEFFQGDLKVAEKRVNFFIKISGGAMAFIGVLIGLVDTSILGGEYVGYPQILIVGIFITLALLVIGYSTLVRIAFMNVNHEKWKKRMYILRNKFRDLSPILWESYFPFKADRYGYLMSEDPQRWGRGGLNSVMLRLNAFILVVQIELIAELTRFYLSITDILWISIPVLLAIIFYYGGKHLQKERIKVKSKQWEGKVREYVIEYIYGITEDEWKKRKEEKEAQKKGEIEA